jgi:photosystem II stability/assembly factor-like uncharacterized protein
MTQRLQEPTLYAGTVGQSVWRSKDGGVSWHRASAGIFVESQIRALAVHPTQPSILFAGTDAGVFRTENGGDRWERLDSPMNEMQIWSLAINPHNPDTIFAGTCPSSLFKSVDGGNSWKQLDVELAEECAGGAIIPRVTSMAVDPDDGQTVYAGIEIDGMRISRDGGETWVTRNEGLSSLDIHGLAVVPGNPKTLVATTNNDVCITSDMTQWTPLSVKAHFPWPYCRAAMYVPNNSGRVYVGAGNGPPGSEGGLFYTRDFGKSWSRAELGMTPNSTIWCLTHHPAVSGWLLACSVSGQLFRSTDGGGSWSKLTHEFGEVRALAIVP